MGLSILLKPPANVFSDDTHTKQTDGRGERGAGPEDRKGPADGVESRGGGRSGVQARRASHPGCAVDGW
jgi:hypothetical protein